MTQHVQPKYRIEDLVDDRNRDLYEEIATTRTVTLVSTEFGWSETTEGDKVVIGCSASSHPQASFTHELLHVRLKNRGMTSPFFIDNEALANPGGLVSYLYNQLAHHKMYSDFIGMGFLSSEFLDDSDRKDHRAQLKRDVPKLEKAVRRTGKARVGLEAGIPYLSSASPESHERLRIEERLDAVIDPRLRSAVDELLSDWRAHDSYDPCLAMARFLRACGVLKFGLSLTEDQDSMIVAGNA